MIYKKNSFTIAEALTALTVLGIIIALTVTVLIKDTSDKKLYVAWRHQYNNAEKAVMLLQDQNGTINFTNDITLRNDFETVMHFAKKDTWGNLVGGYYTYYKNTNGVGQDLSNYSGISALMLDGSVWMFVRHSTDCTAIINGTLENVCGSITLDVNGAKPPNMYGKDFFSFWIVKKYDGYVVYPLGSLGDGRICQNPSNNYGTSEGCSALALTRHPNDMP